MKSGNQFLYDQVMSTLKERITRHIVPEGGRLSSERQLAEEFGVDRITIRRALKALESENLIFRVAGKGTFVKPQSVREVHYLIAMLSTYDVYTDAFHAEVFSSILKEAHQQGFHIITETVDTDLHSRAMVDSLLSKYQCDGYLSMGGVSEEIITACQRLNKPVVLIDNFLADESIPAVLGDNIQGVHTAVSHLIQQGHTRIGYLYPVEPGISQRSFDLRHRGWTTALHDAGLVPTPELELGWNIREEPDGASVLEYVRTQRPTAVFCANDWTAIHLINLVKETGIACIPRDLSVVGFDNTQFSSIFGLTTVAVPKHDLGMVAVRKLINMVIGTDYGPNKIVLPLKFIKRQTTATAKR